MKNEPTDAQLLAAGADPELIALLAEARQVLAEGFPPSTPPAPRPSGPRRPSSQADRLLELAGDLELFSSRRGPRVRLPTAYGPRLLPLDAPEVRALLASRYQTAHGTCVNVGQLAAAMQVLRGRALQASAWKTRRRTP